MRQTHQPFFYLKLLNGNDRQPDGDDYKQANKETMPDFNSPETIVANNEAAKARRAVFAAAEFIFTMTAFVLVHKLKNQSARVPEALQPGANCRRLNPRTTSPRTAPKLKKLKMNLSGQYFDESALDGCVGAPAG